MLWSPSIKMSANLINLRVYIPAITATKMMQFNTNDTVAEAIQNIISRVPDAVQPFTKPENYSIFRIDPENEAIGRWLDKDAPLSLYSFSQGDQIEFRDTNRLLKYKLPDGSVKTIMVDESKPVSVILYTVCQRAGITNCDEYSLSVEDMDDAGGIGTRKDATISSKKGQAGMGLSMKKLEEKDRKKMEKMKQKLQTDDEVRWVDHDVPLWEQGINQNHILILGRKYFLESNKNIVNTNEIELLYVQCRDRILSGALPCSAEEAIKLAGLQLQIQKGDFSEVSYKTINDIKEYVSTEHQKNAKALDKKIKDEYKSLIGMNQLAAKQKYSNFCQELKTYGISTFLGKEKVAGKQKLTPILLGITKESIMRLDDRTKEIVQTWPLTTVKRWTSSKNSFTLDFGDYDSVYCILTTEAEQITKLISGYVDLIIKKKRQQASGTGTTGLALVEDSITPGQGVIISGVGDKKVSSQRGAGGKAQITEHVIAAKAGNTLVSKGTAIRMYGTGAGQKVFRAGIAKKTATSQKAFIQKLSDLQQNLTDDLKQLLESSPSMNPDLLLTQNSQYVVESIASANLASFANNLVNFIHYSENKDHLDYSTISCHVVESKDSLLQLNMALKKLAENSDDINLDDMMKSIGDLSDGFKDMLDAYKINDDKISKIDRKKLDLGYGKSNDAVCKIAAAIHGKKVPLNLVEYLNTHATSIARSASVTVSEAIKVKLDCKDADLCEEITLKYKKLNKDVSEFNSSIPMMAPLLYDDESKALLIKMAEDLGHQLVDLQKSCERIQTHPDLTAFKGSATETRTILEEFINPIKKGFYGEEENSPLIKLLSQLFNGMNEFSREGIDGDELYAKSKEFVVVLGKLMLSLKDDIHDTTDENFKEELTSLLKEFADSTKNLIENAKALSSGKIIQPEFLEAQKLLFAALESTTIRCYPNEMHIITISRLKNCLEKMISQAIIIDKTMKNAAENCRSEQLGKTLFDASEDLLTSNSNVMNSMAAIRKEPNSLYCQHDLIEKAKINLTTAKASVAASKSAVPLVTDIDFANILNKELKYFADSISKLDDILAKTESHTNDQMAEICTTRLLDAQNCLQALSVKFNENSIQKYPIENKKYFYNQFMNIYREIIRNHAQLIDGSIENRTLLYSTFDKVSLSTYQMLIPIYGLAACSTYSPEDRESCKSILNGVDSIIKSTLRCIDKSNKVTTDEMEGIPQDLIDALKLNSDTLLTLITSLPSNKEIENSENELSKINNIFEDNIPPLPLKSGQTLADLQEDVNKQISVVMESVSELSKVVSRDENTKFPITFGQVIEKFCTLFHSVHNLAGNTKDPKLAEVINAEYKKCMVACERLLSSSKLYSTEPNDGSKILVSDAIKQLNEALSSLLITVSSAKPGLKECAKFKNAIKLIYANMMERGNIQTIKGKTYDQCLSEVEKIVNQNYVVIQQNLLKSIQNGKSLADVGDNVEDFEKITTEMLKYIINAIYILGMTDSSSKYGRDIIFDISSINYSCEAIQNAFKLYPDNIKLYKLTDGDAATREISYHTAKLVSLFKDGANKYTGTRDLVKYIVDSANNFNDKSKEIITSLKHADIQKDNFTYKKLLTSNQANLTKEIEQLVKLLEHPEIDSIPPSIGERGCKLQEPLISEGLLYIDSIVETIESLGKILHKFEEDQKKTIADNIDTNLKLAGNYLAILRSNTPGEKLLDEIIERLMQNAEDMRSDSNIVSSPSSSQKSKEYENRLESSITNMKDVIVEVRNIPEKSLLLKPMKLEISCGIMEGMSEIITGLLSTYSNVDPKSKTQIYEILGSINASLIDCANSLKLKPEQINGRSVKSDVAFKNVLDHIEKLSKCISESSQKGSLLHQIIDQFQQTNYNLKSGDLKSIGVLINNQGERQVIENLKTILKITQDISTKVVSTTDNVEVLCKNLLREYQECGVQIFDPKITLSKDIDKNIKEKYLLMGSNFKVFIENVNKVASAPSNREFKKDMNQDTKKITADIVDILKLIQSTHKGAAACSKQAQCVTDCINDLDTCILFAENQSLEKEETEQSLTVLKPIISNASYQIAKSLNYLAQSKTYTDSNMLEFSNGLGNNLQIFLENNKLAALTLSSNESEDQLSILEATKEVASVMNDLFGLIQDSQHNSEDFVSKKKDDILNKANSTLVEHKKAFDKVQQGASGITNVVANVTKNLNDMSRYLTKKTKCEWDPTLKIVAIEDLVKISREIPLSCAKIVQSSAKQKNVEDNVEKANITFEKIIKGIRKFIITSDSPCVSQVAEASKVCIETYLKFIQSIENPNSDKNEISEKSKKVTETVVEFVKKCSSLKNEIFCDVDPSTAAEQELLNAAAAIEMAAKKLSELKPRVVQTPIPNQELNFEGQILEAANSVMKATGLLVAAATSAQKELVAKGAFTNIKSGGESGQWSQGLISAARLVAESTNMLCDAAKSAVEGKAKEENLIAACNSISSSTTQLIMACKVKADPNSESQARLEKAGFAVKKASKNLVNSLKGSGVFKEKEKEQVELSSSKVQNMKFEIEAMAEISKNEKELKNAQKRLYELRQAKANQKNE